MCQLGTFLQLTWPTRKHSPYVFVDVDDASGDAYQRIAIHAYDGDFYPSARRAALEGLCRALGTAVVPACAGVEPNYLDVVTFGYAGYTWAQPPATRTARIQRYVSAFRWAIEAPPI